MRFKIGDNVEVMNNKEVPVSWRTAEILSCSGHTYTVQYDYYPGMGKDPFLEIVPRKFVRPFPSPAQGVENFITGDIVEVFYQHSWKIAAVLNIIRGGKEINKKKSDVMVAAIQNQYLARLLGCSQEIVVDMSNIRMRQSWHDRKWIPMGKVRLVSNFFVIMVSLCFLRTISMFWFDNSLALAFRNALIRLLLYIFANLI